MTSTHLNQLSICAIVPRLLPIVDGVGDYALCLAKQLRQDFNIQTHFIVGDPAWPDRAEVEGFLVERVTARSSKALLPLLTDCSSTSTAVLLHYVGHGYMRRGGSPFWLVNALKTLKSTDPEAHLVTMFHELYAAGQPVWSSDFWMCRFQKKLITQVEQMSDQTITSCHQYANTLKHLIGNSQIQIPVLPIHSNVGEQGKPLPLSERQKRLVIFGRPPARIRAYQESSELIRCICQQLGISEIWDIGPETGLGLSSIGETPILEKGPCSASDISEILSTSIAGFLHYDLSRLSKSGIFAAYCAHGLLPITHQHNDLSSEGVVAGVHYWTLALPNEDPYSDTLQRIANNAYAWYQTHSLSVQAKTFSQYLVNAASTL